jgi:outer membrane protein assembly factor BamB
MMRRWMLCSVMLALGGCGLFSDPPKRAPVELADFKASIKPKAVWSASVGSAGLYTLTPAIINGAVVAAASKGDVYLIDGKSGRTTWHVNVDSAISAGVGAADDIAVVGGPKGQVTALSLADGKSKWKTTVPGELLGNVLVQNGMVVLRSSDARIFALDLATGARLWTLQRPLPSLVLRADAGLSASGDLIYASFPGGRLLAIVGKTGTVRYDAAVALPKGTTELERVSDVVGTPVVEGADVCVAAYQGRIGCLNGQTGVPVWGRDFSAPVGSTADARFVFGVDESSVLQAFTRSNGVSQWSNDKLKYRNLSSPVSFGRSVVVGDYKGVLHFISREDGNFLGRLTTDGTEVRATPRSADAIKPETLLVQSSGGGVYLIGLE